MADQDKKPTGAENKKKKFYSGYAKGIRSAKQDDIYGASNIVLPCPGS
jgi:hypothetical protein